MTIFLRHFFVFLLNVDKYIYKQYGVRYWLECQPLTLPKTIFNFYEKVVLYAFLIFLRKG